MLPLTKALVALVCLSGIVTALSLAQISGTTGFAVAVLVLSGLKARVILNAYLGLGSSAIWRRGFNGFVLAFLILAFAIYLLPEVL